MANPSALFLSERQEGSPGLRGGGHARGLAPDAGGGAGPGVADLVRHPAAHVLGIDANRTSLLLAVLEKRVGLELLGDDVFVSVAGGLEVRGARGRPRRGGRGRLLVPQPSPAPHAPSSSARSGLAGEVRSAGQAGLRVREAAQMGFTRCILPARNVPDGRADGIELVGVTTLEDALEKLWRARRDCARRDFSPARVCI